MLKNKFVFLVALFATVVSYSKDYRDVKVGKFDRSFDLSDCNQKTFLNFMKTKVYGAIKEEAANGRSRDHFAAVASGEGVEIKLTDDVTTYHVKYKAADEENAERSGRSYAAVGLNRSGMVDYLADASDKFYLDSLEDVAQNERELAKFYRAILGVITTCDASGFADLKVETQRVAADFIAVYVAEEYRHLIGGDGELGRSFNWDDALLQVTLLASFHSGQSERNGGMFYEGKFTDQVYNQINEDSEGIKHCFYKQFRDEARDQFDKRGNRLNDYWQFNRECKRSGINMTRSDFSKMAKAITEYASQNMKRELSAAAKSFEAGGTKDLFGTVAEYLISNEAPTDLRGRGDEMVENLVTFLMAVRENADDITTNLKH